MMTLRSFARRYAAPLWPWYALGLIFLAITNFITLEIPQLAKSVVNNLDKPHPDFSHLQMIALAIVGLGVLQILVRSLSRILIFWPGRKLEATAKMDLFGRMMTLPQEFFSKYGMGDLISRLANDIGHLRVFFAFGMLQIFNMIFLLIFTITKMASVNAHLTMICLSPLLLMLVMTRYVLPRIHQFSRENQDALGRLTNRVTEAFVNVHVIQANAAEKAFLSRSEVENQEVYSTNMKMIVLRTLFFPLMASLTSISQLLVLFYGGHEILAGRLSVGDILAFNIYLATLAFPFTSIGIILGVYKRSKTALERLEVFSTEDSEKNFGTALQPREAATPVFEVRNLTFRYPQSPDVTRGDALRNVSFTVYPKESLGLFGPVGSGKSTLFRLLTRLYDPPRGTVFFHGTDVLDWDPQQLRRHVGYALQSVHLFSDSIRDNLTFGTTEDVTDAEIEEALDDAVINQEVLGFEEGLNTKVGEKGIRLSGGQKHRLALARLFLRPYEALIFDDVLAAVDNQTEAKLIHSIKKRQAAVLLASHRIPALKSCQKILYLKDGEIVDQGSYAELVKRHPEMRDHAHADA